MTESTTVLEDVNAEGDPVDTKERERLEMRMRAEQAPPTTDLPATTNWAQVADAARGMSTGRASIPTYLRNTWGDCMAIFDIALRAGLSPYMLARQTYEQNGMMCFMSQAYHALATPYIRGPLLCEYEGEGGDRVCIVKGSLKDDPNKQILIHRSPRLADRHPGFSLKENPEAKTGRKLSYTEGMELIAKAEGKKVQGLFSNGSPLWVTKPDMQLWYDTNRDWIRKYCPRAVLGIYTPDEVAEFEHEMKDVTPLRERIISGRARTGEGFREGHAERELAAAAADKPVDLDAKPASAATAETKGKTAAKPRVKTTQTTKTRQQASQERTTTLTNPKDQPSKKDVKAVADRAEASAKAKREEEGKAAAKSAGIPTDSASYIQAATVWIENAVDPVAAEKRWESEYDLRYECKVPIADRQKLSAALAAKIDHLRGAK